LRIRQSDPLAGGEKRPHCGDACRRPFGPITATRSAPICLASL